jgi:hypothetical protein
MATAYEPSEVQLVWKDPQKMSRIVLWRSRAEPMKDNPTDMTKLPVLPYYGVVFKEQDYLAIEVKTDAADGLDASDSALLIRVPVTCRNKRTGAIYETSIGYAGNDKFTFVADGTLWAAGELKEFGYYQVPYGVELKLGQKNPFNSRVVIVPMDDG